MTVLSPYLPYAAAANAGVVYLHHHLRVLSRYADVTLVVPATAGNERALPRLTPGLTVHRSPIRTVRLLRGPLRRPGLTWTHLLHTLAWNPELYRSLCRDEVTWGHVQRADVVEIHWSMLLPLLPKLRRRTRVPVVVIEHDVHTQAVRRARHGAARRSVRLRSALNAPRVARVEARLLNLADEIYVFNPDNAELLARMGVRRPVGTVPVWLHLPQMPSEPDGRTVLFVAAFARAENVEAALWFLDSVWWRVMRRCPAARIVLAGGDPPEKLRARARVDVIVTGYLDDLDDVYRTATVSVAPLRRGAGLKFKVPQAMAYGLPVVTTTVGAEGITGQAESEAFPFVTDDPAEMAEMVTSLLLDPDAVRAVGARGRAWVQRTFAFDAGIAALARRYDELSR